MLGHQEPKKTECGTQVPSRTFWEFPSKLKSIIREEGATQWTFWFSWFMFSPPVDCVCVSQALRMTPQKRENGENGENAENRENAENAENGENGENAKTAKTAKTGSPFPPFSPFSPSQFLNFCCPQRVAGGYKLLSRGAGWGQEGVSRLLPHVRSACCQMLPVFRSHTMRECTYTASLPCCAVPSKACFGQQAGWKFQVGPSDPNAARTLRRHEEQHASNEADCEALCSLAAKVTRDAGGFSCECGFFHGKLSRLLNHKCKAAEPRLPA